MARGHSSRRTLAACADKYALYQRSVQDPEGDVERARRIFRNRFGRDARSLREDFCGTAALSCAWVAAHREHRALGVDIDPEPLAWGRAHNLSALDADAAARVELVRGDVRAVRRAPVDLLFAYNFSYFLWKTRRELLRYFRIARRNLRPEGLLLLDAYGGPEAHQTLREKKAIDGFTYEWEQGSFDPVSHATTCFIHFRFRDGSRLERAFRYDWRLWSLPELRELLREAGFSDVWVLWEGTELATNEPNGVFRRVERAPDDPAWIAYVVAAR
jgi:SAM-dependent methyltransferase